jgi:recombination protein RecR
MKPFDGLVAILESFPGVGRRTAERFAWQILFMPDKQARSLSEQIAVLRALMKPCGVCGAYDAQSPCAICSDTRRDRGLLCLVEHPGAVTLLERTGRFKGLYHVMRTPPRGSEKETLRFKPLLQRIEAGGFREILVATNATAEGEALAARIARLLSPLGLKLTRIGMGLPAGGEIEYGEEATLSRAIKGRVPL